MRFWLPAALAAGSLVFALATPAEPPYRDFDAAGLCIGLAGALCLAWIQSAPLPVLAAVCAILTGNAAAGYPVVFVQWLAWIALFGCFALHGDLTRRAAAAALAGLAVVAYVALDRGPTGASELTGIAMSFLIATVGGDAAHSRRARVVLEERARLARELHDALGHAVNVMVMQAAVGQRVFAENPAFGREALRHVETLGRGALVELDQLLKVLDPRSEAPVATDLAELAARVRAAGRELDLDDGGVDLPPGGDRALRRIVQEAVTNALRHSASGRIRVRLHQVGDEVRLEVTNEGTGFAEPLPGRGLANMRERARLEGGDLHAGPGLDGFTVRATLPARTRS
ncbi:sensor histidine kinase [Actinocorallia longicatena]|uniref:histidine kinase n=1 Tax=Actinocorallia longicatena TaxID=111803 RepID=A0ABP6Q875_9ACTN